MTEFEKTVRKALIDKEMSISELAKKLGISLTYLYDILNSSRKAEKQKKKILNILDIK
ncbi:hypothetical protein SH1V18_03570 [Vallitalea longa]|uniref:HTH cro/C1-type domain-containing protein n=1 Tax=Vallitalea longa TaxID=2936439 RepID=A0A9W5Y790_9FIRM|nr:helix-turn-helix transcriptional regulator [Vallitalea longa]GKX27877.1 hypothetical protein SH1V18_03570 [Vallitalea longa]